MISNLDGDFNVNREFKKKKITCKRLCVTPYFSVQTFFLPKPTKSRNEDSGNATIIVIDGLNTQVETSSLSWSIDICLFKVCIYNFCRCQIDRSRSVETNNTFNPWIDQLMLFTIKPPLYMIHRSIPFFPILLHYCGSPPTSPHRPKDGSRRKGLENSENTKLRNWISRSAEKNLHHIKSAQLSLINQDTRLDRRGQGYKRAEPRFPKLLTKKSKMSETRSARS